jgi:hypothetical protein
MLYNDRPAMIYSSTYHSIFTIFTWGWGELIQNNYKNINSPIIDIHSTYSSVSNRVSEAYGEYLGPWFCEWHLERNTNQVWYIRDYLESRQFGCCSSEAIPKRCVSVIELLKMNFRLVLRYGQVVFQMLKVIEYFGARSPNTFDELFQRMYVVMTV